MIYDLACVCLYLLMFFRLIIIQFIVFFRVYLFGCFSFVKQIISTSLSKVNGEAHYIENEYRERERERETRERKKQAKLFTCLFMNEYPLHWYVFENDVESLKKCLTKISKVYKNSTLITKKREQINFIVIFCFRMR